MKIVEFRIFMPLKLEWCRAAAKYTVNRRTKEESGNGDGFEIIEAGNFEEDGHVGRYVHRVLHFKNKIPSAIRWAIPEKYSSILETNKNCFPHYVATFHMDQMGDDLICDTETRHVEYTGMDSIPDNIMGFTEDELTIRKIVYLDILDGPEPKHKEFDIHGFSYEEAGIPKFPTKKREGDSRKPPKWLDGYKGPLVLIIKTLKFHLKWKGIQTITENYVANKVIPTTYLDTHRAMLTWINEWFNMTEEDLVELENKTKDDLHKNTFDE